MKERHLEKIWTKDFISIALVHFLMFTVFYALLTTLPLYVINELGESESKAGLVVTFMLISAIFIRPFSAKIIEIFGKKKTLLVSIILFALTTFIYIWMDSFVPLMIVRFIHGISFGIVSTVTVAIAADIIPNSRKGTGMGYFTMFLNLALVAGPFIGLTILQVTSFENLFIILNILMVMSVVFSLIVQVKEFIPKEKNTVNLKLKFSDLLDVKSLPIALIAMLVGFSYASILSYVSVYAEDIGLETAANYFFLVFAIVMIASRPSLGRAFDVKGPRFVLIPSLLIFAVGLVLLGFTTSAILLLVAAGFIGLGYGTLVPGFQTMAIQRTDRHRSSHAISTFYIFYDIGIASGSYILGLIVSNSGYDTMYFTSGAILVLAVILFNMYLNSQEEKRVKQVLQEASEPK